MSKPQLKTYTVKLNPAVDVRVQALDPLIAEQVPQLARFQSQSIQDACTFFRLYIRNFFGLHLDNTDFSIVEE
jgi:hypothetical protein